ncbi:MAG: dCMP deaminase family protein [Planctomycetota bacterium]
MDRVDKQRRRDTHLLRISRMFAEFSTCLSRKVGCVIASEAGHIISTGYNGAPKKTKHGCEAGCFCQDPNRKSGTFQERLRCSHAELNAIAQAAYEGVSTRGANVYTYTFPCSFCCKAIIQAGVRRVVYEENYDDEMSKMLFEEAGIECVQITTADEPELQWERESDAGPTADAVGADDEPPDA